MGKFLRALASVVATGLGAVLLLADSTDDCKTYDGFKGSFDYTNTCVTLGPSEGTVSLDWPTSNDGRASEDLIQSQFVSGGLNVLHAYVQYAGGCSGGKGHGIVGDIQIYFYGEHGEYGCKSLHLPVTGERALDCHRLDPPDSGPEAALEDDSPCILTVRPPAQ